MLFLLQIAYVRLLSPTSEYLLSRSSFNLGLFTILSSFKIQGYICLRTYAPQHQLCLAFRAGDCVDMFCTLLDSPCS